MLKVKSVPLFYLPAMYYPIQKDDRATGFLMPVYGNIDVRGQSVSNAFFWAINRSQDMTLVHDWLPSPVRATAPNTATWPGRAPTATSGSTG